MHDHDSCPRFPETDMTEATLTEMGECEEEKASYSHVESRNLKTFVIGVSVVAVGTLITTKVIGGLLRTYVWQ